jgi:hypothetical protein
MTELYENPARSKREMTRLLNTYIQLNDINLAAIWIGLCNLIGNKFSIEHVKIIISSWVYYQGLINYRRRQSSMGKIS